MKLAPGVTGTWGLLPSEYPHLYPSTFPRPSPTWCPLLPVFQLGFHSQSSYSLHSLFLQLSSLSHYRELMRKTLPPLVWHSAFSTLSLCRKHSQTKTHNPANRSHFKLMTPNLQWALILSVIMPHFPTPFTCPCFWTTNSTFPSHCCSNSWFLTPHIPSCFLLPLQIASVPVRERNFRRLSAPEPLTNQHYAPRLCLPTLFYEGRIHALV